MISVLIECASDDKALAVTLAALVPGAVEGLIADVTVLDRGTDADTRFVAEAAGCRLTVSTDMTAIIAGVRGDWLLFLEPGARLSPGWMDGVAAHLEHDGRPARFARAQSQRGSVLSRFRERRSPLAFGFLVRKTDLAKDKEARSLRDIARDIRTVTMACGIVPADRRRASDARRGAA